MKDIISTIVRFHDEKSLAKLERAIQSLHAQSGVMVQPIIVTQRFDKTSFARTREAVMRQWFFNWLPEPVVVNYSDDGQADVRSDLINLGMEQHRKLGNRFLAFLDYDDIMYSHAYETLRKPLLSTDAAVSFASVEMAHVIGMNDYDFIYGMSYPFIGKNKMDMVKENFCPLHSYMVDCSKVEDRELHFRSDLVRVEDYDFLLRVAGANPCDFSNLDIRIGLYMHRSDGSNSTPRGIGSKTDLEKEVIWKDNRERLDRLRSTYQVNFFASDF
ncbi:MAG: hypothetical protein ACREO7_02435 [Pseudoxanthomonas sp.]